jgi:DNA ligase-1
MLSMKTLYKKDSKGKLRILRIYAQGADLVQESGLADGKLVEARKTCKGKNIGKSNETSPEDQAISEMKSKITEKLKTDYFETEKEAMTSEVILPMLAHKYEDKKSKINWKEEVYTQPKFDGMRCFAIVVAGKVRLISRENTDILEQHGNSMKHLIPELAKLPSGIYDGELYAHGYTFQENMELIKKYRPGESENVKLHAYDFVSDKPFKERSSQLARNAKDCSVISLVPTKVISNEKQLGEAHSKYLSEGYEGTIIRHGDTGYELNHRSNSLLKFKDFIDIVGKVIDVVPMENRPKQGVLVCTSKDASGEFRANLKFSHKTREEILANKEKWIGKSAEIRFFEYTDDGLPRFPVCVGFRLDK